MGADSAFLLKFASRRVLIAVRSFMDDVARVTEPDYVPTDCMSPCTPARLSAADHLIQLIFFAHE